MPKKRLIWVSTSPYQLGEFVAYDLNQVFNLKTVPNRSLGIDSLLVPEDPFATSLEFQNYVEFRELKKELTLLAKDASDYTAAELAKAERIIELNPDYYHAHELAGNFYKAKGLYPKAIAAYKEALSKEIATKTEQAAIEEHLSDSETANEPH
jgi:tetratricopeptide (TPR) repeat protein